MLVLRRTWPASQCKCQRPVTLRRALLSRHDRLYTSHTSIHAYGRIRPACFSEHDNQGPKKHGWPSCAGAFDHGQLPVVGGFAPIRKQCRKFWQDLTWLGCCVKASAICSMPCRTATANSVWYCRARLLTEPSGGSEACIMPVPSIAGQSLSHTGLQLTHLMRWGWWVGPAVGIRRMGSTSVAERFVLSSDILRAATTHCGTARAPCACCMREAA